MRLSSRTIQGVVLLMTLYALCSSEKVCSMTLDSWKRKNTQDDNILQWNINASEHPYLVGQYDPGVLDVIELIDSAGNKYMEFFDSSGKKVVERNQTGNQASSSLSVYFLYGDNGKFNFVRFVLTPMFIDAYKKGLVIEKNLDMYAYQYQWNLNGHNIAKKLPGKGWSYMIYDSSGKIILYQDANQRNANNGRWGFNKYDSIGRILMTGVFITTKTIDELRLSLGNDIQPGEKRIRNSTLGYSTMLAFPPAIEQDIQKVYFYDDYTFINKECLGDVFKEFLFVNRVSSRELPASGLNQLTGEMTKTTVEQTWLKTAMYYDTASRVIQTVKQNHLGHVDRLSKLYSDNGLPLTAEFLHVGTERLSIKQRFKYSTSGVEVLTYINDQGPESIKYLYDSLGYLIRKRWADICRIDYTHEVRSGKYRVNSLKFLGIRPGSDKELDMKISYQKGNELKGRSAVSGIQLFFVDRENQSISYKNSYQYDQANRLFLSDQVSKKGSTSEHLKIENVKYDHNGNILSMRSLLNNRKIDDLTYSYQGNKLIKIIDHGDKGTGFKDLRSRRIEYKYDLNGNLIVDKNRVDLKVINYNSFDLPEKIYFRNGLTIIHSYDADGIELSQTVNGKNQKIRKDYITPIQLIDERDFKLFPSKITYLNSRIVRIDNGEGFWIRDGEKYQFHLYLVDHINRIVGVINNFGRFKEVRNYFPFGEPIFLKGAKSENLNFQIGVNAESLNVFKFKFRQYDPTIGRFLNINVLSELEFQFSPYNYGLNNPMSNEVVLGLTVD